MTTINTDASSQALSSILPSQDTADRIARLPPAKRALLEKWLKQQTTAPQAQPIPPRSPAGPAPLSFSQERVWFLSKLDPDSTAFNRPLGIQLHGPVNLAALRSSLDEIIQRHEILRSAFPSVEGRPVQSVNGPYSLDVPTVDLSADPDPQDTSRRLTQDLLRQTFDLDHGPLIRAALYRFAADDHLLLLSMHHITFDGWSTGIFLRELSALYDAFCSGRASSLPPLPVQYADFAVWQRQEFQDERLEPHLRYWRDKLSGDLPPLDLPLDHPRPAVATRSGALQHFILSPELAGSLTALGHRLHATLFMTMLAAVKVFFYRYTGQTDVIIASPVAAREHVELEGLIGYFINTLVLRTTLAPDMSFETLVGRVSETALGAYQHQQLPFERLTQELQPERDMSRPPLFQVMFNLENVPRYSAVVQGLTIAEALIDSGASDIDLTIDVEERQQQFYCLFHYNSDLFDADTISRMMGHFQTLLAGIVAAPQQSVATLPLLTDGERYQLLVEWNATQADYPREATAHMLFEQQVQRTPDAPALYDGDQQMTYGELNRRANQFAHHLLSLGAGLETMVGVCLGDSLELIIALFGIMKAGGVYVPLDPSHPPERLNLLLEDSQAAILVARQPFPGFQGHTILWKRDDLFTEQKTENPVVPVRSNNLAYMIYTSGSTGLPKGVLIEHRSLVNYLQASTQIYATRPGDRALLIASISYDGSLDEIFSQLVAGGAVVIWPQVALQSVTDLLRSVYDSRITTLGLATAHFHEITANLTPEHLPLLSRLRLFSMGGERLMPEYIRLWRQKAGELVTLINGYGPTEATITVTHSVLADVEADRRDVSIGRPIGNTQFYILDAQMQPVPIGVPGELYLGGVCLARGYWRRPELTAERFIPNPFSAEPGARLYRTGDVARYRPDAHVEIVGRADRQLKIRGFRIELGEIEAVLLRHPQVQTVIAVAREDKQHNKRVVAYIVPRDPSLTAGDVRQFMEQRLPKYMIPAAFVLLAALPRTVAGKIDHAALPAPDLEQTSAFVAPRDSLEKTLVEVWEQVLGVQPIGIRSNFFEIGGHSLLAVRLFSRLEKVLGRTIPLASLFQAPTIEQLAVLLRHGKPITRLSSMVAIQPHGTRPPLFCMHPVNGGVFIYRRLIPFLGPDQPIYGLQARGMDGEAEPFTWLEDMVDHYAAEIRTVQPHGPYYVCGYSFGGPVALEVARRLMAQGEDVAFLGLIADQFKTATARRQKLTLPRLLLRKSQSFTFAMRHIPAKYRTRYLRERIEAMLQTARGKPTHDGQSSEEDSDFTPAIQKIRAASTAMIQPYIAHPYYGPVTYFLAKDEMVITTLWQGLKTIPKGDLTIVEVPGAHMTVMNEQNIAGLGNSLRHILNNLAGEK